MSKLNCIGKLFLFGCFFLATANASAVNWIVENRSKSLKSMAFKDAKISQAVSFGQTTYESIELPDGVNPGQIKSALGASKVTPNLPIGLIQSPKRVRDVSAAAWHTTKMKYSDLPKEKDGTGIVVAVLDTGVEYKHPQLKAHIWENKGEIAGNNVDDDNNGFVDDKYGYDFAAKDSDPSDDNGHGTHCAGIIAADIEPNGTAMGVAQGVKIMPVRMIVGSDSNTFILDAAKSIKYAVDNGANVLSNSWRVYSSWGYGTTQENLDILRKAIEYAETKGAVFVAAAGNESLDVDYASKDPIYPAGMTGLPNLFVIASSEEKDQPSSFTNFGVKSVQVAAPGSNIRSTYTGGKWATLSGTSMATPLTAGVIARGMSAGMTWKQATEKLMTTSEKLSQWKTKVTSGLIYPLEFLK